MKNTITVLENWTDIPILIRHEVVEARKKDTTQKDGNIHYDTGIEYDILYNNGYILK